MAIKDRNLSVGTKLVANYKKETHAAEVVETSDGIRYRLADGREFKTPSGAGAAVMGPGRTCNGWAFFSIEGDQPSADPTNPAPKPQPKPRGRRKVEAEASGMEATAEVPEGEPGILTGGVACEECGEVFPDYASANQHALDVHPA